MRRAGGEVREVGEGGRAMCGADQTRARWAQERVLAQRVTGQRLLEAAERQVEFQLFRSAGVEEVEHERSGMSIVEEKMKCG